MVYLLTHFNEFKINNKCKILYLKQIIKAKTIFLCAFNGRPLAYTYNQPNTHRTEILRIVKKYFIDCV